MYKKRFASVLLALVLLTSLSVSVYAHGCRGRGYGNGYVSANCTVCALEDCTAEGRHSHDGVVYCGYPFQAATATASCSAAATAMSAASVTEAVRLSPQAVTMDTTVTAENISQAELPLVL